MRVLATFDKFKDCMTAAEACAAAVAGVRKARPNLEVESAPLTDGGEGFVEILTQAAGGRVEKLEVRDARFRNIEAALGWVQLDAVPEEARALLQLPASGSAAIVEMAQASGLQSLRPEERDPWQTSSYGTGEFIRHAIAAGADAIILGIGGSATNDLGLGALEALGLIAYDHRHQPVARLTPSRWRDVASLGGLVNARFSFPPIRIACDVTHPLLGDRGATFTFGPQKGLQPEDAHRLERAMRKMSHRLLGLFGHDDTARDRLLHEPGAGAAGGIGFGLRAALPDSAFVAGFEMTRSWIRLQEKLSRADCVLTGEGALDKTSLEGKGPGAILNLMKPGQHAYIFAGRVDAVVAGELRRHPSVRGVEAISPPDWRLERSLREGPALLEQAVRRTFTAS